MSGDGVPGQLLAHGDHAMCAHSRAYFQQGVPAFVSLPFTFCCRGVGTIAS